jgi:hypothetical protein
MNDSRSAGSRKHFTMQSISKPSTDRLSYVRALTAVTVGLLMLGACAASWAAVNARLEPGTVQEGETLTLTIESDTANSRERPDVTSLHKDFDVLGTSINSETRIVNGSRSDRTRWLVRLQPRRTGIIDIAPITVGTESTPALKLNVTEASPEVAKEASKHAFLEVEAAAADESVYVQQQIPYTIRLYYDDTVKTGELAAPDPANAIVEQLGEDQRYTVTHEQNTYNVIERRYAIAPERSGTLVIPPASFRGTVVPARNDNDRTSRADDLMARFLRGSPLGNDPFFRGRLGPGISFSATPQPVTARSQEIKLNVQPRPASARGHWLPAEQITLHDSWQDNPPQFKVGEPLTRTITIDAKGLAAAQIPSLSLAQPDNARVYPEAPDNQSGTDGKTIYGRSKQSVTYIPTAQGTLDVPPIELAWWNTRSNVQSRAVLPRREFNVEPGASAAQAPAPVASDRAPTETSVATPLTSGLSLLSASLPEHLQNRWAWLASAIVLLAMLIVSFVAIRRLRRPESNSPQGAEPPRVRRKSAMRALQQACGANDRHAAQHALLDLAQVEWPGDSPRSLGALADRLESGVKEISALDQSLYGAGGSAWQGDALWSALRHGLRPKRGEARHEDDGLGALYLE